MSTVSPHAPWSYAIHLPHNPRAPRVARLTLRATLTSHGMIDRLDTAELLASELATNAYRHSQGPAALRVRQMEGNWLRVSVWDTNPLIPEPFDHPPRRLRPVPTPAPPDSESGRGLHIVQLCADNWGGYPLGDDLLGRGGKLLWFELAPPPPFAWAA
ncbi:ATP-binding protein [Streptomyces sp. NPDC057271]|uniref:ATP-binding protein n=1 Tax=unclassified Streptomyces TaxID=2593676 RepID=UPI0036380EE9